MPSRRDRDKNDATRTPLADLAPSIPERVAVADGADATMAEPEPMRSANTDIDPSPVATAIPAETARSAPPPRPGARKIRDRDRSGTPFVPRTIAEMQSGVQRTVAAEPDAIEDQPPIIEESPPELFVSPRTLFITSFMPFVVLAFIPALLDLLWHGAGLSRNVRLALDFVVTLLCSAAAFALLVRGWRIAFHTAPTELHPRSVLDLWELRASGARRDGWITGSLAIVAGFVVMLFFIVLLTFVAKGLTATYAVPYLIVLLLSKAVGATIFVGYLQRGLSAIMSPTRAALTTGLLYGVALALWNVATIVASNVDNPANFILTYVVISLVVAFATAWIRLRSTSLIAAIAFQLLLLLLGFSV